MAERLFLGLKIIFSVFQILLLSLQVSILLIHGDFSLLDAVLGILDLAILVVDELFVLAFQLKEFLLRLMDLLVFDAFGFYLSLGYDLILLSLQYNLANNYISCESNDCAD